MKKTSILTRFAIIILFGLFCSRSFTQTIQNGKVLFDLTKPGQEARLKSADASIMPSQNDGITLSTRSRKATIESESIEVPIQNVEPFLGVALTMKYADYEGYFSLYLRNSKDNKTWSDWEIVEHEEEEPGESVTDLIFLDKDVKYVQFQISMRKKGGKLPSIKDISLFFTSPGSTPKGAIEKSVMETKMMVENTDPTTKAYPRPSYVNRKSWGCPQPENTTARTLTTVTHLIVHHSASNTYSSDFAAVVRSYWDWHVNGRGWADIGYNWLVDRNGIVYKGRAWYSSTKENVQGAHNSINGGTSGICMIGNFVNGSLPSTNQWNSSYKIMAFLCDKFGLNPTAVTYHAALGRNNDVIDGHKDSGGYITGTTCPGDIAKYYSTIRNSVKNLLAGTTAPSSLSAKVATCPSNNVTFNWKNKGTGWQIHVSTSSNFSSYYLKWVSGLTTYTGPTGFVGNSDNKAFGGFTQGTKYYWRIYYNGKYTSTQSFTMHSCPPTNLTTTQASCPEDDVTFKWTNSGTGWQIHVSTSSNFSSYYLKWVSGKTSYTGPTGFVGNSDNKALTEFKEGTKYYWRMYYADGYTSTQSFTTHTCSEPVANFAIAKSEVCSGSSVSFTNSSQYANSYSWKFPGGSPSTSTSKNPVVTYNTPGTYTIELTVTNAAGSSSKSSNVVVLTTPEASFTANSTSVIPNQDLELNNASKNATSYTWNFSGGSPSSSTETNPVVNYSSPGLYTITLTAKNGNCQDIETKTNMITVANSITILDDFETDEGHFNRYPTYSGTTVGITSESTQSRVTNMAFGGSGSLQINMTDNASISDDWFARILSGTGNPSENKPFANSGVLTFWLKTSTANSDALVQIWVDDSDGLEASPFVSVANDGKWHQYSFDLSDFGGTSVTTGNGELDASEVTLDAIILAQSNTSSTWTVYLDDVKHDLSGKGTFLKQSSDEGTINDIVEEEISEILVYPNPNRGLFTIDIDNPDNQSFEIDVINTSGTLVYSTKSFSNRMEMDIQDLPEGMYFVNIRNNDINKTISVLKQ